MKKMLMKDRRPDLVAEWHPDNIEDIDKIGIASKKKIKWCCYKNNRHIWETTVCSRIYMKSGCPFCSGNRVLKEGSFGYKCGNLLKEWDYDKNKLDPFSMGTGSDKGIWWKCKKNHSWKTAIKHRTVNNSGCPYCKNKKVCKDNCLSFTHPELANEWNFDKNNFMSPDNVIAGSHKKVWWLCKKGHEWEAVLKERAYSERGCPFCSNRRSKPAIKWLDKLKIDKQYREKYININGKKFYADGFDPKTNTVYEYFGRFWHGHPNYYDENERHPIAKKTYGELYRNTLDKIDILKAAGYNVVYKWGV